MIKYICECERKINLNNPFTEKLSIGQVKLTAEELVAWQKARLFNITILGAVEE